MPDPQTGIPSFQENEIYDYGDEAYTSPVQQQTQLESVALPPVSSYQSQGVFSQPDYSSFMAPPVATPQVQPVPEVRIDTQPTPDLFSLRGYGAGELPVEDRSRRADLTDTLKPSDKGVMARLSEATGLKEDTLARLGLGGIQAIIGARASKKAAEQSQRSRQDMEALAAPYLQKGAELQRQAQAGELTPVARQQLQASQAQAAQAAASRGGVGAQQTAARIEALRSQLLQQQYDYGLKLSGIGDQIYLGAIKTGLQADQVVNQMTNSYYNNIMRTLMPQPKYVIAGQPNVTTE
jgi:hypothetical protein